MFFFNFNLLVCLQSSAYAFVPQFFWQVANCTTCAGACNCQSESSSQSRGRLRSANLSDAMETCSLAPTSFVCDHCRKVFANAKNLARHIEKYHKGWVFFVSKIDFYFFFVGTRLPLHIRWDLHLQRYLCLLLLPRVRQPLLRWWTTTALSAPGQGGPKMSWPDTSVQSTSEDSVVVVLALSPLYLWIITT